MLNDCRYTELHCLNECNECEPLESSQASHLDGLDRAALRARKVHQPAQDIAGRRLRWANWWSSAHFCLFQSTRRPLLGEFGAARLAHCPPHRFRHPLAEAEPRTGGGLGRALRWQFTDWVPATHLNARCPSILQESSVGFGGFSETLRAAISPARPVSPPRVLFLALFLPSLPPTLGAWCSRTTSRARPCTPPTPPAPP